jgi:hypothetical protein
MDAHRPTDPQTPLPIHTHPQTTDHRQPYYDLHIPDPPHAASAPGQPLRHLQGPVSRRRLVLLLQWLLLLLLLLSPRDACEVKGLAAWEEEQEEDGDEGE